MDGTESGAPRPGQAAIDLRLPAGHPEACTTDSRHAGPEDPEGSGCLQDRAAPLYNGRVLLTLGTGAPCWGPGFDYGACGPAFARHGLRVPSEDYELPLRQALDAPEVRRFLCFSSCWFLTLLAPTLYVLAWCALFSTFHLFLRPLVEEHLAVSCLGFSAASVLFAGAVALLLGRSRGQVTVNSDVRLMRANEGLRGHRLLVGLSDCMESCMGRLQLTFCFFDVGDCLQRLIQLLEGRPGSQNPLQAGVRRKMGGFCVSVMESGPVPLQAAGAKSMDS
ncbi:transmembrane protein 268-like [Rhinatrema bivittatum]|uniref:transmembrane protein 268-like n=1 Tax=Rhinatrema bivittatum TaxID=194408 RepID=UPI00112E9830|nr:transmembrane protein 268-like [Rhinatrema bivittatum]